MAKWTDEHLAMLGVETDAEVAERTGRTVGAVTMQRRKLGISASQARAYEWSAEEDAMIGAMSDAEAAEKIGVSRPTIAARRHALGKPSHRTAKRAR